MCLDPNIPLGQLPSPEAGNKCTFCGGSVYGDFGKSCDLCWNTVTMKMIMNDTYGWQLSEQERVQFLGSFVRRCYYKGYIDHPNFWRAAIKIARFPTAGVVGSF